MRPLILCSILSLSLSQNISINSDWRGKSLSRRFRSHFRFFLRVISPQERIQSAVEWLPLQGFLEKSGEPGDNAFPAAVFSLPIFGGEGRGAPKPIFFFLIQGCPTCWPTRAAFEVKTNSSGHRQNICSNFYDIFF